VSNVQLKLALAKFKNRKEKLEVTEIPTNFMEGLMG
jgi:hypothetical protein